MSNNNLIPFNKENSIFGNLEKKGLSTAITGNGFHSYCKMIVGIKCKVFNEPLKWYDGILHIVHYDLFSAHFLKIGSHRDINPQIIPAMFDFINVLILQTFYLYITESLIYVMNVKMDFQEWHKKDLTTNILNQKNL